MEFKNTSKRLYVGFNLAGGDPNCEKIGVPVRIWPGEKGSFKVVNRSTELALKCGILKPVDKEAKLWADSLKDK